ncbi:MAG: glycosyltransferase family 39 protein [Anaerolineae bacterium]
MADGRRSRWMLLGILLVAAALRFYRLDGQSLWYDEGTSAALATRDPITIARNAADDIHPPLYYEMLRLWTAGFGRDEVALRGFSALSGVAVVWVTYLLGRELVGRRAAIFAGAVAAFSPLGIYYSQEVRMYVLVTLWGALAVLSTIRFLMASSDPPAQPPARPSRSILWLFGYLLFASAALYTHYFGFTMLLVANGIVGLWMFSRPALRSRGVLVRWIGAQAAVALVYLPWLLFAGGALVRWPATSAPFSLAFLGEQLLRSFSLGLTWDGAGGWMLLVFLGILILGVLPRRVGELPKDREAPPSSHELSVGTALIYLLTPPLAMYLLSLSRPFFSVKLLLLATPAFHILLGGGIEGGWTAFSAPRPGTLERVWSAARRALPVTILLFLAAASVGPLWNYYFDPAYARDDYRGLARHLEVAAGSGDAILLNAPTQVEIFSYYYGGEAPVFPFPIERPPDPAQTEGALQQMLADRGQIHAVLWATEDSDPEGLVESWLDTNAYQASDAWYGNVRLASYGGPGSLVDSFVHLDGVRFGEGIGLAGFAMAPQPVQPGGIQPFSLLWEALAPMTERFVVSLQALDRLGHIVGQRDSEPAGGSRPTSEWQVGEEVQDHIGLRIQPGTDPGTYDVILVLYGLDGSRLTVRQSGAEVGDHLVLGSLEVARPG